MVPTTPVINSPYRHPFISTILTVYNAGTMHNGRMYPPQNVQEPRSMQDGVNQVNLAATVAHSASHGFTLNSFLTSHVRRILVGIRYVHVIHAVTGSRHDKVRLEVVVYTVVYLGIIGHCKSVNIVRIS